jgi:hypothetical protein
MSLRLGALGGRYGSLEPASNKSYIELEYEYAQKQGKPFFAVVIHEDRLDAKVRSQRLAVDERNNPEQLKSFRALVTSKLVKFWRDPRDIKLAIYETLSDFARREELVGWIPGDQVVNSGAVSEEIARLGKENAMLRERLSKAVDATFCGLTFDEMYQILLDEEVDLSVWSPPNTNFRFNSLKPSLLDFFWALRDVLAGSGYAREEGVKAWRDLDRLQAFGLVEVSRTTPKGSFSDIVRYGLTDEGKRFLLRLKAKIKAEDELSRPDPASGIVENRNAGTR